MVAMRVGVVGAGTMGAGVAESAANAGHEVVLRSRRAEGAAAGRDGIAASLARRVSRGSVTQEDADALVARIHPTHDLADLADCEIVLESVEEDLPTKIGLFEELDRVCSPEAVLATNTSTLPVVDLAMRTQNPERVCGLHFFNPAPVMSLVEVVRPLTASDETIKMARAFAESCGKTPVETADRAGFVVNALLFPYLNDAVGMLERGVADKDDIDAAMKGGCNHPMGPFALLDLVGLDVAVAILEALHRENPETRLSPAPLLRRMVTAGWLGRKSGRGFYEYGGGR